MKVGNQESGYIKRLRYFGTTLKTKSHTSRRPPTRGRTVFGSSSKKEGKVHHHVLGGISVSILNSLPVSTLVLPTVPPDPTNEYFRVVPN